MSLFQHLRSFLLWALEFMLVVVWITTIWKHSAEGELTHIFWAIMVLGLLVILYYAEGIELAIADLLDKQPEQLGDESVRRVLREIQEQRGFFFAQRQLFVVAIIVFMSLMTSYPWLYVPWIGRVESYDLPFWFSLAFTTLTVLWFCQVTPKRLAVINSERFLRQSKFLWPVIKFVGMLGLPGPSDQIIYVLERFSGYREKRHLRPSRATHYDIATQLYGFSLDRLRVRISVRDDGSATIVQRLLVLFVHGEHTQLHGRLHTGSSFIDNPRITPLALYLGRMPEQFESIASDLDAIFDGDAPVDGPEFGGNLIDEWPCEIHNHKVARMEGNGEEVSWIIRGLRPLPESLWSESNKGDVGKRPFVAFMYEVEAEVAAGAFAVPGAHHQDEYVQFPCRKLSILMEGAADAEVEVGVPSCEVALHDMNAPLPEEIERCRQLVRATMVSGKRAVEIPYPLQGGIYRIHWEIMRRATADADRTDDNESEDEANGWPDIAQG